MMIRSLLLFVVLFCASVTHAAQSLPNVIIIFTDVSMPAGRACAMVAKEEIESFEKVGEEGAEAHWAVKLKGLDERLPISRRQQFIVKEFKKH